jgi:hypothetical protein
MIVKIERAENLRISQHSVLPIVGTFA